MFSDGAGDSGIWAGARRETVYDFLAALARPYTYNPRRNTYTVFGFLWGLPIPLFSIGMDLMARGAVLNWTACVEAVAQRPVHWLFLAHPLLFAVVFGAMGSVRHRLDRRIRSLIGNLESKVREVAEANDRLKDLDRLKSRFLANVSHELKTPMVCLSGYTDMMAQERLGPITEDHRKALAVMERNLQRLLRLIEELLEHARLEAGRAHFALAPFDLAETARAAVEPLTPILQDRNLRFDLRGADRTACVLGDREKVLRVLVNLLSNACKFTPRGKRVGLRLSACPDGVSVLVWDEGIGLSPEDQAHLFERFWQADDSLRRAAGGTGLGLAIVKEILDHHGSRIQVRSRPGRGTRVRFVLPAARPKAKAPAGAAATAAAAPPFRTDRPPAAGGTRDRAAAVRGLDPP
jgi:signal transduction histidine kinase